MISSAKKCPHCNLFYFSTNKTKCPHCGREPVECPDFLKKIFGGFDNGK